MTTTHRTMTPVPAPADPCCTTAEAQACCAPEDKTACCGAGGGCGCR